MSDIQDYCPDGCEIENQYPELLERKFMDYIMNGGNHPCDNCPLKKTGGGGGDGDTAREDIELYGGET